VEVTCVAFGEGGELENEPANSLDKISFLLSILVKLAMTKARLQNVQGDLFYKVGCYAHVLY
jgi:hypothetical protein